MATAFANTFVPVQNTIVPVDPKVLADTLSLEFHIPLPPELAEFYQLNGAGYFGENEVCLLGLESRPGGREDLVTWNKHGFWEEIFPKPEDGGPLFFAETCFGDQIGFRWENGVCIPMLFCVETFESFRIGETLQQALAITLADPDFLDRKLTAKLVDKLGHLPSGSHYAPIVSPLMGGSDAPDNFDILPASLHLKLALATFKASEDSLD